MKTAILSDVHGNLEALQAVADRLREEAPERVWCLGDAVGYGPEPNECLELLQSLCQVILMGNHDAAAVGLTDLESFNIYAQKGVEYAAGVLTPEHRTFISRLPYRETRAGKLLVHASPLEPQRWHYVLTARDAELNFQRFTEQVGFIGHSHQPRVLWRDEQGRIGIETPDTLVLQQGRRYLVNVGSVGQPRDGDPRAAFVIHDDERGEMRLIRVPYDVPAVQAKMRRAGLPEYLVSRLAGGK